MGWKEQLDKAITVVKEAAESVQARDLAEKAKATATTLVEKSRR